jgi:hypothetical protein
LDLIFNAGCNYIEDKDVTLSKFTSSLDVRSENSYIIASITFKHIKDSYGIKTFLTGRTFGHRPLEIEYGPGNPSRVLWLGGKVL